MPSRPCHAASRSFLRLARRVAAGALVALSPTAVLAGSAAAQAGPPVLIDFEELATPTTPEFGIPSPLAVEGGFVLRTTVGGVHRDFNVWGSEGVASHPGSTALFANLAGARIDLFHQNRLFDLYSMNLAPLYATSDLFPPATSFTPFTVRFFGFYQGATTSNIFQDFLITTPGSGQPTFTSIMFDARWRGLELVTWFQQSTTGSTVSTADPVLHQFDNILVATVPEPATVLLFASGLLLIGVVHVGRRRTAGQA